MEECGSFLYWLEALFLRGKEEEEEEHSGFCEQEFYSLFPIHVCEREWTFM